MKDLVSSSDGKPWRKRIRVGGPVSGTVVSFFTSSTELQTETAFSKKIERSAPAPAGHIAFSPLGLESADPLPDVKKLSGAAAQISEENDKKEAPLNAGGGKKRSWDAWAWGSWETVQRDMRQGLRSLLGVGTAPGGYSVFVWVFR